MHIDKVRKSTTNYLCLIDLPSNYNFFPVTKTKLHGTTAIKGSGLSDGYITIK